jgi:hypothetical protein
LILKHPNFFNAQRLKNKQTQSIASPYFFQVAIDQFVLIPKTHLSNGNPPSLQSKETRTNRFKLFWLTQTLNRSWIQELNFSLCPMNLIAPFSKHEPCRNGATLRNSTLFFSERLSLDELVASAPISNSLKSIAGSNRNPNFVYKPKENHAELQHFLQESRLPKSQSALQNALKAPLIGIEPIQEIYNKLHFALKSKDQSIQDQTTPIPTILSSFFASSPPGTKLQTYNAAFRDYLAQHKKYRQSLKRYLTSHSPVCSTCHLQHKHDQNPNDAPSESEQHLFFDCPKTKLHLQNLEVTLDKWLKSKSKGKVSILDLWPQTTVSIPKLLFWFILGYVPGNLSKLSKQHRAFGSPSNLLDSLLLFVEQTVKHIKKTKKLADATHFLVSQEH